MRVERCLLRATEKSRTRIASSSIVTSFGEAHSGSLTRGNAASPSFASIDPWPVSRARRVRADASYPRPEPDLPWVHDTLRGLQRFFRFPKHSKPKTALAHRRWQGCYRVDLGADRKALLRLVYDTDKSRMRWMNC